MDESEVKIKAMFEKVEKLGKLERLTPLFFVTSVVLAFVVGVLWQKVSVLERGTAGIIGQSEEQPAPTFPPPVKLSDTQVKAIPAVSEADWIRGEGEAPVYLIEYSDLECPFCKQFHSTVQRALSEYGGKVTWVYRHFPIEQLHSKAPKEAEAAECAGEQAGQSGFWKFVDKIFETTPSNNGLDLAKLPQLAADVGLNQSQFKSCLDSSKFEAKVDEHYQKGVSAGVGATPTNFVLNKKGEAWIIPGAVPFEQLKATIDAALGS